eukprot:TRINITY_DN2280_c0_g1_i3.p1 TRINITY_DN2280_c0_g1~~TRINITY_DN2280_c0_g1_i3.p1  ORF type:complete len:756 (+),score=236.31 TRINITY_DN2280_c0_g1_i3:32-2299(+)
MRRIQLGRRLRLNKAPKCCSVSTNYKRTYSQDSKTNDSNPIQITNINAKNIKSDINNTNPTTTGAKNVNENVKSNNNEEGLPPRIFPNVQALREFDVPTPTDHHNYAEALQAFCTQLLTPRHVGYGWTAHVPSNETGADSTPDSVKLQNVNLYHWNDTSVFSFPPTTIIEMSTDPGLRRYVEIIWNQGLIKFAQTTLTNEGYTNSDYMIIDPKSGPINPSLNPPDYDTDSVQSLINKNRKFSSQVLTEQNQSQIQSRIQKQNENATLERRLIEEQKQLAREEILPTLAQKWLTLYQQGKDLSPKQMDAIQKYYPKELQSANTTRKEQEEKKLEEAENKEEGDEADESIGIPRIATMEEEIAAHHKIGKLKSSVFLIRTQRIDKELEIEKLEKEMETIKSGLIDLVDDGQEGDKTRIQQIENKLEALNKEIEQLRSEQNRMQQRVEEAKFELSELTQEPVDGLDDIIALNEKNEIHQVFGDLNNNFIDDDFSTTNTTATPSTLNNNKNENNNNNKELWNKDTDLPLSVRSPSEIIDQNLRLFEQQLDPATKRSIRSSIISSLSSTPSPISLDLEIARLKNLEIESRVSDFLKYSNLHGFKYAEYRIPTDWLLSLKKQLYPAPIPPLPQILGTDPYRLSSPNAPIFAYTNLYQKHYGKKYFDDRANENNFGRRILREEEESVFYDLRGRGEQYVRIGGERDNDLEDKMEEYGAKEGDYFKRGWRRGMGLGEEKISGRVEEVRGKRGWNGSEMGGRTR